MERAVRLEAQALAGEAAEEALPVVSRVFAELRAEVYRELESEDAELPLLQAKLLALRAVEERLGAYGRAGRLAVRELNEKRGG